MLPVLMLLDHYGFEAVFSAFVNSLCASCADIAIHAASTGLEQKNGHPNPGLRSASGAVEQNLIDVNQPPKKDDQTIKLW